MTEETWHNPQINITKIRTKSAIMTWSSPFTANVSYEFEVIEQNQQPVKCYLRKMVSESLLKITGLIPGKQYQVTIYATYNQQTHTASSPWFFTKETEDLKDIESDKEEQEQLKIQFNNQVNKIKALEAKLNDPNTPDDIKAQCLAALKNLNRLSFEHAKLKLEIKEQIKQKAEAKLSPRMRPSPSMTPKPGGGYTQQPKKEPEQSPKLVPIPTPDGTIYTTKDK